MATFFDYEKAYDKVWRDGLMYKMEKLNIPSMSDTFSAVAKPESI